MDDVLLTKVLDIDQAQHLIEAVKSIKSPVMLDPSGRVINKASSSYELIIESAHFSLEFNCEDVEVNNSETFQSLVRFASLIEELAA